MIQVSNIEVWGLEHAIRGMRNPKNSWDKSDTELGCDDCGICSDCGFRPDYCGHTPRYVLGAKDSELAHKLYENGPVHRTYARLIKVSMDIVAPLYWWKEMDRYCVGKDQVSCSTMHTIAQRKFTLEDFSTEHLLNDETYCYECTITDYDNNLCNINSMDLMQMLIQILNCYRDKYLETKDKKYWWQLIQLLPSSYNQRRTICMSYENVFEIIRWRKNHKLDEWVDFVNILGDLPEIDKITNDEE